MQKPSRPCRRHVRLAARGDLVYGRSLWKWLARLVLTIFFLSPDALAQASIKLQWDPSPDSVAGYRVYYRRAGKAETNVVDVKLSTKVHIDALENGHAYQFFVTAYSADGRESDPSNIAIATPAILTTNAPPAPSPFADQMLSGGTGSTVVPLATDKDGLDQSLNGTTALISAQITTNLQSAPQLKAAPNGSAVAPSLAIEFINQRPILVIGGGTVETGPWTLETSVDLSTWTELALGDTPERIELNPIEAQAFFRVYSLPVNLEVAAE